MARPLLRFLGVPDPIPGGLSFAVQAKVLQYIGGPKPADLNTLARNANIGTRVQLVIPRGYGSQSASLRLLVRVTNQGSEPGQVRVLPVTDLSIQSSNTQSLTLRNFNSNTQAPLVFSVPVTSDALELHQAVPTTFHWIESRSVALDVLATSGLKVEVLAVVPLAAELSPPPPQHWSPDSSPDNAPE
jgi:hypothetical protein